MFHKLLCVKGAGIAGSGDILLFIAHPCCSPALISGGVAWKFPEVLRYRCYFQVFENKWFVVPGQGGWLHSDRERV